MLSPMMQCAGRIRVKDCPFGAPDGVADQFQLVDRHGHPVTKDVRIASIHQTDWQGRVELSSEPRTNWVDNSNDFESSKYHVVEGGSGTVSVTSNYTDGPATGTRATRVVLDIDSGTSSGSDIAQIYGRGANVSEGTLTRTTVWAKTNDGSTVIVNSQGQTDQITYAEITREWRQLIIDAPMIDGGWFMRVRLRGSEATSKHADLCLWGMSLTKIDEVGAYIPTNGSPVTVTDYTHDGSGGVTTGQVPEDGASLDWSGTARRAA